MEVLFVFLKWVASFAHTNEPSVGKIDLQNLATVISPNILYSQTRDVGSFNAIRVVTSLLENQQQFFMVPEEFIPALRDQESFANSMELSSKEFMKKCDAYMRKNANMRRPPMLQDQPRTATSLGGRPTSYVASRPRSDLFHTGSLQGQ